MAKKSFDLIVLGAGPGGIEAAIAAHDFGLNVLLVGDEAPGGGSGLWGTVPSKSLRYAALRSVSEDRPATWAFEWMKKAVKSHVLQIRKQLGKRVITFISGRGKIHGPQQVSVGKEIFHTKNLVLATGGKPAAFPDWNEKILLNSDKVIGLKSPPKSLLIVGAGIIGCEYASIFATLGTKVTLVDRRRELLRCLDQSLIDAISSSFGKLGIKVILGAELSKAPERKKKLTVGINGKSREFHSIFICMGRVPQTRDLGLESVGLKVDERGFLKVHPETQATELPWIYGVGDIVGAPGLAAAAQCQGLRAAGAIAGKPLPKAKFPLPMGIYTIPELAGVGLTEAEAKEKNISFLSQTQSYESFAKPAFREKQAGTLKILSCPETGKILGAHAAGWEASEVINFAALAIGAGVALPDMAGSPWNYPTAAEAFRVAARSSLTEK